MNVVITGFKAGIGRTLAQHRLARAEIATNPKLVGEAECALPEERLDHGSRK